MDRQNVKTFPAGKAVRNHTIDIVRIIASFFVVCVHIQFPEPCKTYVMALARFAVPFFLMVSGWFLRRQDDEQTFEVSKRFFFSVLRLTIISALIISAVNTAVCLIGGRQPFSWFTGFFARHGRVKLFLLYNWARFLSSVMWYLFALVYAMLIYMLLSRFKLMRYAYFLILPLLVLNLVRGELFGKTWYYQGNWLLTSLPFLLLGSCCREKGLWRKISVPTAWILIVLGAAATLIEAYFVGEQILYVGTLSAVAGIFALSLHYGERTWPPFLCGFGSRCTRWIFILHCSLRDLAYVLFGEPSGPAAWFMPFVFFFVSGCAALLIVKAASCFSRRGGGNHTA